MASKRLRRILKTRLAVDSRTIFGDTDLVTPDTSPLKSIRRVAILSEAFLPKVDGVTKTAYLTLRYLQETRREVLVFAPDVAVPNVGNTEVVRLPSIGVPEAPETRMALPTPYVARRLHDFKPDLIHLFSPALMAVNGMAMGRHLNVPVVANYQTDLPGYALQYAYPKIVSRMVGRWLRYLHNGCHLTLVPTSKVKTDLQNEGYHRLRLWGRGIDSERFHPKHRNEEMRQRLLNGRDPNSLVCLYVGRLANEKRIDLLLKVAEMEGIALTIVGDGAKRQDLEKLFAHTDTHFTGYLYGDELAQAYASAELFTFTGQNETFGQVIQEAMASGLPAIVVNEGGAPDLVTEGITGFTCPASPSAFAKHVKTLQDYPALLNQMRQNARQYAENRPWSAIMTQLENYYREAVYLNERFKSVYGYTTYHIPFPVPTRLMRRTAS